MSDHNNIELGSLLSLRGQEQDHQELELFTCSRCTKSFRTAHALGGHQNAHRGERFQERFATRKMNADQRAELQKKTRQQRLHYALLLHPPAAAPNVESSSEDHHQVRRTVEEHDFIGVFSKEIDLLNCHDRGGNVDDGEFGKEKDNGDANYFLLQEELDLTLKL